VDSVTFPLLNSETQTFSNHPFRKIEIQKGYENVRKDDLSNLLFTPDPLKLLPEYESEANIQ
jgi:hypothetical protein